MWMHSADSTFQNHDANIFFLVDHSAYIRPKPLKFLMLKSQQSSCCHRWEAVEKFSLWLYFLSFQIISISSKELFDLKYVNKSLSVNSFNIN